VRIGVVIIDSIVVNQCESGELLVQLRKPEDFDDLYLGGTIKRMKYKSKAAFLSYGIDPWFYLPQITTGAIGDELEVTIELREIGLTQFANSYSVDRADALEAASEGIVAKLLRRVAK